MDKDNRKPKDADTGKAQAGYMWQIRKSEEDSESESARDIVKVKMWNEKMQQQITCSTKKKTKRIYCDFMLIYLATHTNTFERTNTYTACDTYVCNE